jgi:hypothetical protein
MSWMSVKENIGENIWIFDTVLVKNVLQDFDLCKSGYDVTNVFGVTTKIRNHNSLFYIDLRNPSLAF